MKKISWLVACCCCCLCCLCATSSFGQIQVGDGDYLTPKALRVGDTVPGIVFRDVMNYGDTVVRLADLRGKPVILDFWNTTCVICIRLFPELDSLQRRLGDSVRILSVGVDGYSQNSIRDFVTKRAGTPRAIGLPVVIESPSDSVFRSLFPRTGFPHEVWIDRNGVVMGITGHQALTLPNLRKVIAGEPLPFEVKKVLQPLDPRKPYLLPRPDTTSGQYVYGSAFCGYQDTLVKGEPFSRQLDERIWRFYDVNQTVFTYYKHAYRKQVPQLSETGEGNKWILNLSEHPWQDWDAVIGADNWTLDQFNRQSLFGYELILPRTFSRAEAEAAMVADFDRFFQLKSSVEKRKVRCLVLVPYKGIATSGSAVSGPEPTIRLKDISSSGLIQQLDFVTSTSLPIVDGTATGRKYSLSLPADKTPLHEIRLLLQAQGLDLREEQRTLTMLVLRDKK